MTFASIGDIDVAARVEETIKRRGADKTVIASIWTSLGAAGGVLAIVAMFVTWYADDRTATAWFSGFLPPIALLLVVGAAAALVAKPLRIVDADRRIDSDLFAFAVIGGGALLLMLRQLSLGGLND
ncbi:MAG: hypothetical protein QMB08_07105, partial [Acidimicrobiales bacterium]